MAKAANSLPPGSGDISGRTRVISKSTGREVDRTRSLAAHRAAATRKANREQTAQRTSLRLHHKIIAAGAIIGVVLLTAVGIHTQLSTFAATSTTKSAQGFDHGGGLCMDNAGGKKANGNPIRLFACNATAAQTWTIDSQGRVKNANGYCLDTPGTKPKAGDQATLRQCVNTPEMRWNYSGGKLVNQAVTSLCLSGSGSGSTLTLQKCSGSGSQKWTYKYITVTTKTGTTTSPSKTTGTAAKPKPTAGSTAKPKTGTAASNLSSKQQLARSIMSSGKVSFISVSGVPASARQRIFADIASGRVSGNSTPCGLNIRVLRAVKTIIDNHSSISISDTNSLCNNLNIRSFGSRHYAGNGSALDIAAVDGVVLTGGNAKSIQILKEIAPLLITGSSLHDQSQVGQQNCRGYLNLGRVQQINDYCSHVHIDFPPWSDPSLKYLGGAY